MHYISYDKTTNNPLLLHEIRDHLITQKLNKLTPALYSLRE